MFENLLSSVRIGRLELPNRLVVAPMGVEIAEADGHVREPVVAYYAERARGGAGLIITENTSVGYPQGANSAHELGVSDDAFLPGLRALTEAVHAEGGRIAIQLAHHANQVVPREELYREVWGHQAELRTRSLDIAIVRLRKKVEEDIDAPRHVITVHGLGYRFESQPRKNEE